MSTFWQLGCFFGGSGIFLGAFGAHGLSSVYKGHPELAKKEANWKTASQYQLVHSVALLITAQKTSLWAWRASMFLSAGMLMFSGSIYALTLLKDSGIKKILGPITPLGGLCFIAGWACLAFA
jgi:uncharacterized membrane protein YgdD (TMEM256/DUF423 family)